jgi:hypothetical protein
LNWRFPSAGRASRAAAERRELVERRPQIRLAARDAHVRPHHVLQVVLHRVRILTARSLERRQSSRASASTSSLPTRSSPACAFA